MHKLNSVLNCPNRKQGVLCKVVRVEPSLCTMHCVLQNFLAFLNTAFLSLFSKSLLVLDVGKNKASLGCLLPGAPRAHSDERDTTESPGNYEALCPPLCESPLPILLLLSSP